MESELAYTGEVVVFDLDDTLYKEADYLKSGFRAVAHLASSLTGEDADTLYADMMAERLDGGNAFDMLAGRYFGPDSGFVRQAVGTYRYHKPQIAPSPGADELLRCLATQGTRLAIITDGRSVTQRNKIEALGISRHFPPANILISEETGAEKSALTPWQTVVRTYPNASRFIYVGDNPAKDFRMPRLLGWFTVGLRDTDGVNIHPQEHVPSAAHAPHVWIDRLTELSPILTNTRNNKTQSSYNG